MKRFLTWALALVLALSLKAFAEGANGYYQKGDKIEDFAAALSDGTEVTRPARGEEGRADQLLGQLVPALPDGISVYAEGVFAGFG